MTFPLILYITSSISSEEPLSMSRSGFEPTTQRSYFSSLEQTLSPQLYTGYWRDYDTVVFQNYDPSSRFGFHALLYCAIILKIVSSDPQSWIDIDAEKEVRAGKDDLILICRVPIGRLSEINRNFNIQLNKKDLNGQNEKSLVSIDYDVIKWKDEGFGRRPEVKVTGLVKVLGIPGLSLVIDRNEIGCGRDSGVYFCAMTAIKKDLSVVANARSEELTIVVTKPPENLGPILFRDSNGLELPSRNFSEGMSIDLYCAGDAYLNSGIRWCIKREKDTTFAVIHDITTTRSLSYNGYHYKQHSSLSLEVTSDDMNTEVLCESGYETLCGTGTANATSSFMFYSSYETSTTNVDDTYSTFNGHATLNELTTESTPNEPSSLQNRYSSSPFTTEEFSSTDESLKSTNMFVQKFSNSSTESSNTIQMSSFEALTTDETDVLSTTASPANRTEGFSTSTPPAYKTTAIPYYLTLLSKTISTDETKESIINRQSPLYMRENITDGTKNTTRSTLSGATLEFHSSESFPTKISTEEMHTTDIEKTIKTSSFTNWETTVHVDNFTEITVDLENKTQNSVVYVETTTYNGTNSNTTSGSEPKLFDTTTEKISLNSKHAQTTENEYSSTDTFTQESAQISILKPNFQDGQSTQSVLHSTGNSGKKYTEITTSNNIEIFKPSVFSLQFLTTMPVDAKVTYRTDESTLLTDSTNTKMISSSVSSTAYSTSAISKPTKSTDSTGRTTEIDQTSTIPRRTQEIDRITSSFMPVSNTSALTAMVASAVSGDHKTSGINAPFTGRPTFQSNSVQPLTTPITLTTRFRNGIQRKTPTVTSSIKTYKKTNPIHLIMTTSKTRRPRPNKHPIHQSTNFPRQTAKTRRPKQPKRTTNVPYGLKTSTSPSKTSDIPAKWHTIQLTVMTAMSVTVVVTMAIGLGLIWKAKLRIAAVKIKPSLAHV